MTSISPSPIDCGHAAHDHADCIQQALEAAEAACERQGVRLTQLRRRVLELVWQSEQPVGAYALLDHLREDGQTAQPPTVYRALDFLMEQGLVHRIQSQNAYIGCKHPGIAHAGQFLICLRCGHTAELDDPQISRAVEQAAARDGFSVERQSVEIAGLCGKCRG